MPDFAYYTLIILWSPCLFAIAKIVSQNVYETNTFEKQCVYTISLYHKNRVLFFAQKSSLSAMFAKQVLTYTDWLDRLMKKEVEEDSITTSKMPWKKTNGDIFLPQWWLAPQEEDERKKKLFFFFWIWLMEMMHN